jgi:heme-degrading monooxygenase HmoA
MHARMTVLHVQAGKLEEAIKLVRESIVPAARQQHGFKKMVVLSDPGSNKVMSMGYWESEDDIRSSESSGYYQEQLAKMLPLLTAAPMREFYSVNLDE